MRKWCLWAMTMVLLVAPALGACPNKCSGHGSCGTNDVCACMQNWVGGDCSMRLCPLVRAWQDTAVGDNDAHYYKECGNRGTCDREKGICDCDVGFVGSGCRRMACPDDCSGHGVCDFIEELAQNTFDKRIGGKQGTKYDLWDREKIMGCKCDPGYEGHSCTKRTCPKGNDELTPNQIEMKQAIIIEGAVGFTKVQGYVTYFDPYGNAFTTSAVTINPAIPVSTSPANGPCLELQTALRKLPNNALNTITVDYTAAAVYPFTRYSPAATSTKGMTELASVIVGGASVIVGNTVKAICIVNFKAEPGSTGFQYLLGCNVQPRILPGQQPMTDGSTPSSITTKCTVTEVLLSGTANTEVDVPLTELAECSGRGLCDYTSGTCKCFTGHMGLGCEKQEALV